MSTASTQAIPIATRARPPQRRVSSEALIVALIGALVAAAWGVSRLELFRSGDDISYWIAVSGGSMMLLLFAYPMRKYLRFMQPLGTVKWWFWLHVVLGIIGPWLILVHSTFRVGSLNAAVALYSMVIVVVSGVVGRFIHVRIHRGLHGERTSLHELRAQAGLTESHARSRLSFAPQVQERLAEFERRQLASDPGLATSLRQVLLLPWQQWRLYRACAAELREPLRAQAALRGWPAAKAAQRQRQANALVRRYLHAVVRVVQFTAYQRVFALWHVAHRPFLVLLVASALVHVVAVHAY